MDTVALPVEFLNGALLVSEESSGALEAQINALDEVPTRASLILFEEGAQVSCEAQRLSGECTRADDCALKVIMVLLCQVLNLTANT